MKTWRTLILGLVLFVHGAGAIAALHIADKIVAVVDDSIVLESDVNTMLTMVKLGAQKANNQQLTKDTKKLRRQVLERLIMDNIITQLTQRVHITISNEQLNHAIGNIAANNHMTLDKLRCSLAHDGMDYNAYLAQIRKEMLIAEVRNSEVRRRVNIYPQEIDSLSQHIDAQNRNSTEFNLSYILIPVLENPTQAEIEKAEALANSLVAQSKNGADFQKLAPSTYSDDPQALQGGQIGWRQLEELPVMFSTFLQSAQKDSIIGPIFSGVGFHVLKVNDIHDRAPKIVTHEVKVRHILLRTSLVLTDQQARATLEKIAAQIKSGHTSFHTIAQQLSEDQISAPQGGNMGWSTADAFDLAFRNMLMHLKKGEISPPVRSSFGWHLIQLLDTRLVDRTAAAQKDRVYRLLFNRKFTAEKQTWMQEQRAAAYVKIIDDHEQ